MIVIFDRHKEVWIRSALVALDYNHGAGRDQAVDSDGTPRYKLNVSVMTVRVLEICTLNHNPMGLFHIYSPKIKKINLGAKWV